MSAEVPTGRPEFIHGRVSIDPFDRHNLFYMSLAKMGYPIYLRKVEDDEAYVMVRDGKQSSEIRGIHDRLYSYNVHALVDSISGGGGNEILYLVKKQDELFYEEYPRVEIKLPLSALTVQASFMRAHERFLEYLERDPIAKNTDFPKEAEKQMYQQLKARFVNPIGVSQLQRLIIQSVEDMRRK